MSDEGCNSELILWVNEGMLPTIAKKNVIAGRREYGQEVFDNLLNMMITKTLDERCEIEMLE